MFYVSFNLKKIGRYEFLSEYGAKFGFTGPNPRLLAIGLEPGSLSRQSLLRLLEASAEVIVVLVVVFASSKYRKEQYLATKTDY